MFRRHYKRRSTNLVFVIFRLLLSVAIFAVLAGGVYSAYKQFSGFDPITSDPKAIIANFLSSANLNSLVKLLPLEVKQKQDTSESTQGQNTQKKDVKSAQTKLKKLLFTFALVADSHNDNALLKKALQQTKDISFIIGVGDYSDVGTLQELQSAKQALDESKTRYFVVAGDHDLWDSRDKQKEPLFNFSQVFGPAWQIFEHQGVIFLLLHNSDNYKGFGEIQIQWLSQELEKIKKDDNANLILAFVHEPLYHPSSDHVMGRVEPSLKEQAKKVTKLLKEGGVKEVFAGDIHYFTRYTEPETGLNMTTVGAVTTARNTQLARFALVEIYDDGSYNVEDVEIK